MSDENKPNDMDHLCPGIAKTVHWLQSEGFITTDSGDGVSNEGMECALDFPNVFMVVPPSRIVPECNRLMKLLREKGVEAGGLTPDGSPKPHINGSYDPSGKGEAIVSLFYVDDKLLFG
jgi:hypothetical protein